MNNWQNMTLGDIGRAASRYRPFIAVLAGVLLLVVVLPGRQAADDSQVFATGAGTDVATTVDTVAGGETTVDTTADAGTVEGATGDPGAPVAAGGATGAAAPKPGQKVTAGAPGAA
ncbi:MAG: hypothetical protein M3Q68_07650, partial [Actinomycetota bacterium]|nr:hypothetical protein [Actinomycetota bacterium]